MTTSPPFGRHLISAPVPACPSGVHDEPTTSCVMSLLTQAVVFQPFDPVPGSRTGPAQGAEFASGKLVNGGCVQCVTKLPSKLPSTQVPACTGVASGYAPAAEVTHVMSKIAARK